MTDKDTTQLAKKLHLLAANIESLEPYVSTGNSRTVLSRLASQIKAGEPIQLPTALLELPVLYLRARSNHELWDMLNESFSSFKARCLNVQIWESSTPYPGTDSLLLWLEE